MNQEEKVKVQIKDLLEAGVHFGHQTRRWNPKMKPYIFKEQNGIYIIDLRQTLDTLQAAYDTLLQIASEGKTILFVGTKRQAKDSVREDAERCGMYYINERWLGGTLTNFKTIKLSLDRLDDMEEMERDGRIEQLSKKERLMLDKHKQKLLKVLSGIRGMKGAPSCLIVFDTNKEEIAIKEAKKLGIPLIGLIDTNSDPDDLDYAIPANDDAIRSIKLFTKTFADAIAEGRARYMKNKDFLEKQEKAAAAKKGGPKQSDRRGGGHGKPPARKSDSGKPGGKGGDRGKGAPHRKDAGKSGTEAAAKKPDTKAEKKSE
jgi:small subunit ribosomal protein S2